MKVLRTSTTKNYREIPFLVNNQESDVINFEGYELKLLSKSPLLIEIDNFLSDDEINAIISSAVYSGMERSTGYDSSIKTDNPEEKSYYGEFRTSTQAWIGEEYYNHPQILQLENKVSHILGLPRSHFEYMQVLNYKEGQHYECHHDYIVDHRKSSAGGRLFSVFFYLNNVEEGGYTDFPRLNIRVKPQKGKAIIWNNTLNIGNKIYNWPIDIRTDHHAMPVVSGQKWAANLWVHYHNWRVEELSISHSTD